MNRPPPWDPVSAESVLSLIRQSCKDENVAMLMVTHSMDVASQFERIEKLDEINRAFVNASYNSPE